MRRASVISLVVASALTVTIEASTPASAQSATRLCAQWLYGASLVRRPDGGLHYQYDRQRCLRWITTAERMPVLPFFAVTPPPSPWVSYSELNPQPLPPRTRTRLVR
jgi:hypothetical protein